MIVTPRDIAVLKTVAHLGVATCAQIRSVCFPSVKAKDGRSVRARLQALTQAHLLNRTFMEVTNPLAGMHAPVYFSSREGIELLVAHLDDESLRRMSTQRPQWQHLAHFVSIADLHLLADRAIAAQGYASMPLWFNEFDTVNPQAHDPAERFRLYTKCSGASEKRIVCVPDCAFLLEAAGYRKAHYVELERGTNPPQKAAAEKTPGYVALAQKQLHRRHFPDSMPEFTVLVTAPEPRWRDQLRKAFRQSEGQNLFKFASQTELNETTFLFEPVWYPCVGDPVALVKRQTALIRRDVP